jgi:hypothetical protein
LSSDADKTRGAGCDAYISKPYSPRQLLVKVREYLPPGTPDYVIEGLFSRFQEVRNGQSSAAFDRFPSRPGRSRLCRGPERGDRIPLRGESIRPAGYRSEFAKIVSLDYGDPEQLEKFRKIYRVKGVSENANIYPLHPLA